MTDETIRKQVYELLPSDLEQFPIWEFALDEEGEPGQDEATVKPHPDLERVDPDEGMFVVRATFRAADGTVFSGYVTPSPEADVGFIQPTVVTDSGQVNFWFGALPPEPDALQAAYGLLGKSAQEMFPIAYKADVPADAELEGELAAYSPLRLVRRPADRRGDVKRRGGHPPRRPA